MLEKCKMALRISNNDFDDEIQDLIDACITELKESGIELQLDNPLYQKTIITFVKKDFGWNNDDYDKLSKSYNSQKIFLMNIGELNE